MLRRLHWLVLRRLPGPFLGWLGILVFLLLMQFLIRWLPEIAGKGIPVLVIVELIAYNLAYMVVLAVPMSVLLASLMAFGKLAETKYYTVMKSSGISFGQIVWPALITAFVVCMGLLYFNSVMLPEANFRARQLWGDIRSKRPGFELQPGVFYDGLENYSILVQERPSGTNRLLDVTIYDYTNGRDKQAVLKADRGRIQSKAGGRRLTLILKDGEMHRPLPPSHGADKPRYEQLRFDRHVIHFNLSDVVFTRSDSDDGARSTRTMRLPGLLQRVDTIRADIETDYQKLYRRSTDRLFPASAYTDTTTTLSDSLRNAFFGEPPPPLNRVGLAHLSPAKRQSNAALAVQKARSVQSQIEDIQRDLDWLDSRLRSYQVEIHKKFSIAVACLIFMFIGAPLGLALRRGGLAIIGVVALGIFMFYWVSLVQGEKLSERGFFPPWLGMWIANLIMSGVGLWLLVYIVLDLGATPPLRTRLWTWLTSDQE